MNFYEAFQEGSKIVANQPNGIQKLRFFRPEREPQYICITGEEEFVLEVQLAGVGTTQERIISWETWVPEGIDLMTDDWNYHVAQKRIVHDANDDSGPELVMDQIQITELVPVKVTVTSMADLPELFRTAAQVLEAHLRTGADEIETINNKD